MKNYLFLLSALAAMPAFGQIYDYNFSTSLPTDIDWDDIGWTATETTQNRDRYYVNINNAESANVYVRGGATVNIADNASMYLQNDTRLIIGDAEGSTVSTMHFIADGSKDTFLEITGRSSVLVNKNGVLSIDANRPIRWWNASNTLPDDFESFVVDGGTVNGNFNTNNNPGPVNIIFKNGATLNRNTEANPLQLQGKSTFTFDNSTYNVWNVNATQNNGFGNHSMNTAADNHDYRETVTLTNGSIWNGAGVVADNAVTYYDFSSDITSSGMSGADLTLQLGRATSADSYFDFKLLNGSKISAKNVMFGSNDGTRGQQMMGSLTFEMQGTSGNISTLAAFGGTNMNLSRASGSDWTNNFLMKGYAKYQTVGGFNIGFNEVAGSTANVLITGTNNVFQTNTININAGRNTSTSDAVVNISTEGATNSTFSINGMNIYSGGDSKVNVKIAGSTNTFNTTGNMSLYGHEYTTEGTPTATIEFTDGITFDVNGGISLQNKVAGENKFIVSNGANATIGGVSLVPSTTAGSTGVSSIIVDSATLTTKNNWDYANNGVSSLTQIILKGDGATITSNAQMNLYYAGTGTRKLLISMEGTNGTLEAKYNFNYNGKMTDATSEGGYFISMTGSGNTLKTGTTSGGFNLNTENATGGTYQLYSKSDSATNKNVITVNQGELNWQGYYKSDLDTSVDPKSTARTQLILAGNTIFQRAGGGNTLTLKLGEFANRQFWGGDLLLEINGSGNEIYLNALYVGNGARLSGEDRVRIVGGGSVIDVNTLRMMRGAETSWENPVGGILEYKLDDTGISALKVNNGFNNDLSGLLKVDFTAMEGNYDYERFVLMSANVGNLETLISQYWYDFGTEEEKDNMMIIGRGLEDESWEFAVEDSLDNAGYKDFVVYYTGTAVIPEPATCAAILGALALAFAAYRRRK